MAHYSAKFLASLGIAIGLGLPVAVAGAANSPHFKVYGLVVVWGADAPSDTATVPIVSDFIIDTGNGANAATSGDADLIAGDVFPVISGSLTPVTDSWANAHGSPMILRNLDGQPNIVTDTNNDRVMDASDAFGAFRLRQASDTNTRRMVIKSSFYVASNTAFSIDATATPLNGTTLADLNRVQLRLRTRRSGDDGLAFGSAAQFPATGGPSGGSLANNRRLSTMTTGSRVFEGTRRTARLRGSLAQQSVRFDLRYRYNSGNVDLSNGVFDVEAEVVYTVFVP